jgi:starch phosphorylase
MAARADPPLSRLLADTIGAGVFDEPERLIELEIADDVEFQNRFAAAKRETSRAFRRRLQRVGVRVDLPRCSTRRSAIRE